MNIKSILLTFALGAAVTAQAAADKVVGFYPYWSQYSQFYPKDIRYNFVTDIHYVGLAAGEDGSVAFADENDAENFKTLYDQILKVRPNSVKGGYIKSVTLSTTMGPGIKVSID